MKTCLISAHIRPRFTPRPVSLRPNAGGRLQRWTRYCGLAMLCCTLCSLLLPPPAWGQFSVTKVTRIEIKHVGPVSVSDPLIRSNIRLKPGDPYLPLSVDEDVRSLYATGLFYNVRVALDNEAEGLVVTYLVQANPRLADLKFQGNKKFANSKLQKTITSKVGEPFNERKLFNDTQEIEKLYQKKGYPRTTVKYSFTIDEAAGRATAAFDIAESPKIKIAEVDFVGAKAFTQYKLRHVIKTRKRWMLSWITGSGVLKEDQFEDDKEKLTEFYREHGYLDFEIKDVQFLYPTPRQMIIKIIVSEGTEYHVGSIQFTGNRLFSVNDITNGLRHLQSGAGSKSGRGKGGGQAKAGKSKSDSGGKHKLGPNGLQMDVGDVFSPKGLTKDTEAVEDFYGARGYIDVTVPRGLNVVKIPNTERGTMDLEFRIDEGQKSYIEKIQIRGNIHTKDKVIRRELAVSPGEVFDMVRVKRSKQRLEGLTYFEKVDTRAEATDVPNRRNLLISVDEGKTGNVTLGAGFSSVESLLGYVEYNERNFDLGKLIRMEPWFQGGGQRFRLRLSLGTELQDYSVQFIEPWFLGKKLQLGVKGYYQDLAYLSLEDIYTVNRGGGQVSLTRALGSDFLIGSLSYGIENVGIDLSEGFHGDEGGTTVANVPPSILDVVGFDLLHRFGATLAYDTRNSVRLPDKGQRSEIDAELVTGDRQFYKLEAKSAWYFRGLVKGHVLEVSARTGVAESLNSKDVPFYDRYYLGGIYSLRGFDYHSVSPRERDYSDTSGITYFGEPVGGDSYWFGTIEYSVPIYEQERGVGIRFAVFYDIGNVSALPYSYNFDKYDDNYGFGLRLNLPIGPIRLDYGIPIHHDEFNGSSGSFGFSAGWTREF